MEHGKVYAKPGKVDLRRIGTQPPKGLTKAKARELTEPLLEEMEALQELMYGAGQHSLLVVVQGMDAAGKDGGINHLGLGLDALGVQVVSFKTPTPEELSHDFLWRVHRAVPGRGQVTIYNRSHYEDVGIVRVHGLVPEAVWAARYEQINQFEALLAANKTIVIKFWLHISPEEQRQRLMAREADPAKAWKLNPGDWEERAFWADYQAAYSDAIGRCAAEHAPWVVVPADKKWYRDLCLAYQVVKRLRPYADEWRADLAKLGDKQRAALEQWRAEHPGA